MGFPRLLPQTGLSPAEAPKVPHMFSAPMFRRERRVASGRSRPFLFRTVLTVVLGLVALLIGAFVYSARSSDSTETRLLYFGRAMFIATLAVEFLFMLFFVPSKVARAIAEEREKGTFSQLLLTRLTPSEIVLIKVFGRWLPTTDLILISVPFLVIAAWAAALEAEAFLALLVLLSGSAFMASLSILASSRQETVVSARGQASFWCFAWLIGLPLLTLIPVSSGTLWGDLLVELKRLCSLLAPSSPLSLATDPGWYHRTNAIGLVARVAILLGLQAIFGLLAILLAARSLEAREPHPNWLDPTKGHRPSCSDDPIFWREYELPSRKGAGPLLFIQLRYVWILIRVISINLLSLFGAILTAGLPIGVFVGAIYYGQAAFRESWENSPSHAARENFHMLILVGTGLLAALPVMVNAALVGARIQSEVDKKTWEDLLTTPLTASEIIHSKAKAALYVLWRSAVPLPFLWAAGIACGVVTVPGVILAAIDLGLAAWASVAAGLIFTIKPGSTNSATNKTSLTMLAYMVFHAPLLWAALASPSELAWFGSLGTPLRWAVILAGLAIPTLTGYFAWFLTRRVTTKFDEWVGRPIRPIDKTINS